MLSFCSNINSKALNCLKASGNCSLQPDVRIFGKQQPAPKQSTWIQTKKINNDGLGRYLTRLGNTNRTNRKGPDSGTPT